MNVLILKNMDTFHMLTSCIIAKQHLIAVQDGPGKFRILKDRINSTMIGAKVDQKTLHWFLNKK